MASLLVGPLLMLALTASGDLPEEAASRCGDAFADCREDCSIAFGTKMELREKFDACFDACHAAQERCREGAREQPAPASRKSEPSVPAPRKETSSSPPPAADEMTYVPLPPEEDSVKDELQPPPRPDRSKKAKTDPKRR